MLTVTWYRVLEDPHWTLADRAVQRLALPSGWVTKGGAIELVSSDHKLVFLGCSGGH